MAKRFTFKARDGSTWSWSLAELADTLLESETWGGTRGKIAKLKPGQSMRRSRKGDDVWSGTLTRVDGRTKNPKPKLSQLGMMSEHGRVHEIVHGETVVPFRRRRPILFWSPSQRALVVIDGVTMPRPRHGAPPRDDRAAATWERFHGKSAGSWREDVPVPAVELRDVGHAVSIAYRGPRWNNKVAEHPFGRRVRAYQGQRKGETVYVIAGGTLRMTARGIEG